MTTFVADRERFPVPPDALMDEAGAFCPVDEAVLRSSGYTWVCPPCGAAWDHMGRNGRWLPLVDDDVASPSPDRLLDRRLAWLVGLGMGSAIAFAAGVQSRPFADEVPDEALYWASAGLLAVGAVVLLVAWLAGVIDRWPYRHNQSRPIDAAELAERAPQLAAMLAAKEDAAPAEAATAVVVSGTPAWHGALERLGELLVAEAGEIDVLALDGLGVEALAEVLVTQVPELEAALVRRLVVVAVQICRAELPVKLSGRPTNQVQDVLGHCYARVLHGRRELEVRDGDR